VAFSWCPWATSSSSSLTPPSSPCPTLPIYSVVSGTAIIRCPGCLFIMFIILRGRFEEKVIVSIHQCHWVFSTFLDLKGWQGSHGSLPLCKFMQWATISCLLPHSVPLLQDLIPPLSSWTTHSTGLVKRDFRPTPASTAVSRAIAIAVHGPMLKVQLFCSHWWPLAL